MCTEIYLGTRGTHVSLAWQLACQRFGGWLGSWRIPKYVRYIPWRDLGDLTHRSSLHIPKTVLELDQAARLIDTCTLRRNIASRTDSSLCHWSGTKNDYFVSACQGEEGAPVLSNRKKRFRNVKEETQVTQESVHETASNPNPTPLACLPVCIFFFSSCLWMALALRPSEMLVKSSGFYTVCLKPEWFRQRMIVMPTHRNHWFWWFWCEARVRFQARAETS